MDISADPILIPLINTNEPEAQIAALHVGERQAVSGGDPLCTLETTKSTSDLCAERDGYVVGLRFSAGQTALAGDVFCYLADSPDWQPERTESVERAARGVDTQEEAPDGLRITQPALAYARMHQVDLMQLPLGRLITQADVCALLEKQAGAAGFPVAEPAFDPQAILVYGGGGHGKSLIDLLRSLGTYRLVGVVDDGLSAGIRLMGLPVLGGGEVLQDLHKQGVRLAVNAVGGIGNIAVRVKVFRRLAQSGFVCPAVAHPTAFVEPSAMLSAGVQVFPHAYLGSEARVGFGSIVNTGAIVSHDCLLGDYVNISPGAMLAGAVQVGSGSLVGMGVTVNLEVKVGAGARIGNGATVKADVPEKGIVRAGAVWPE
jgi:acetyltransferase EpsM